MIEAAYKAALTGETLYTPAAGTPALRKAVADKFRRENGLDYEPDDIVVANSAKQIIFNALMATLGKGDEAVLPAPYFVSYPEMVKLLGGVPVIAECPSEARFRLTPEVLDAAITPKTKWLFLNILQPLGCGLFGQGTEGARRGAGCLAKHPQVLVLSDEIYEHIVFDGREFVSFGVACPEPKDRTLIVNGVAKAYAMTGWRVGYAAGPAPLVKAMNIVQSQCCTPVAAPMQAGALAALTGPQDSVRQFRTAFDRRRNLVVTEIAKIQGLFLVPPEGAFYAYIGYADLIGRRTPKGKVLTDDVAVSNYLLAEGHVSSVPGAAYGLSPFFRISTAASDGILEEAITRIGRAVAALQSAEAAPCA